MWSIIFSVAIATVAMSRIAAPQELSLQVVSPEPKALVALTAWLGIRNGTEEAAFMCVSAVGASKVSHEGTSRVSATGFSPHACENDEAYTLVLPHEATYQAWRIPEFLKLRVDDLITVRVGVFTKNLPSVEGTQ